MLGLFCIRNIKKRYCNWNLSFKSKPLNFTYMGIDKKTCFKYRNWKCIVKALARFLNEFYSEYSTLSFTFKQNLLIWEILTGNMIHKLPLDVLLKLIFDKFGSLDQKKVPLLQKELKSTNMLSKWACFSSAYLKNKVNFNQFYLRFENRCSIFEIKRKEFEINNKHFEKNVKVIAVERPKYKKHYSIYS